MRKKSGRTKRRKASVRGLSTEQVDEALRHLLTSTLALYVLKNSKRPASTIVKSLMNMEIKAAQLVGMLIQMQANGVAGPKLETTLAGMCSFIPTVSTGKAETSRPTRR